MHPIITEREREKMVMTTKDLGELVRKHRKELKMTQADLAMVSGSGVRFISDLENGKESCHLGMTLRVLENLGLDIHTQKKRWGGEA